MSTEKNSRTAKWRILIEPPLFKKERNVSESMQWLHVHLKIRPSLIFLSLRYKYVTDAVEMFAITRRRLKTDCFSPLPFSLLGVTEKKISPCVLFVLCV